MGDRTCSIPGCTRPHWARSWCSTHYRRWYKTGSTDIGPKAAREKSARWSGDKITYSGMHQRLHRERGGATNHTCVHCGARARQWAYDHADPNERTDNQYGPYSVDPAHYIPLCMLCHRRFDVSLHLNRRTTCRKGLHPFPENLVLRGVRKVRVCRACERERQREYNRRRQESR